MEKIVVIEVAVIVDDMDNIAFTVECCYQLVKDMLSLSEKNCPISWKNRTRVVGGFIPNDRVA
jgi:hypothetical protein